jgi:hypothetical protein
VKDDCLKVDAACRKRAAHQFRKLTTEDWQGGAPTCGQGELPMSGHFVADMAKLIFWPPKRERRAYPTPAFSPPQKLGYPEATHGARSQLVRPRCTSKAARPASVIGASRLPAVKELQMVVAR